MNTLLRQELGQPVYSWQWSEDVVVLMRDVTLGFEYKADPDTGVIAAQAKYIQRPVTWPKVFDRWILCKKIYTSQREWLKKFAGVMLWPENGEWHPCESPLGYVALDPNEAPSLSRTWRAIQIIRESRSVTAADFLNNLDAVEDKRERDANNLRRDMIRDKLPAFGGVPGQKMDYSFGGFEVKAIGKEATSECSADATNS